MPPRRWIGYTLLALGLSFLIDTITFIRTNWSPLKIPMDVPSELAAGCFLCVAGMPLVVAARGQRMLLRTRVGVALILIAASICSAWGCWMATRTWVPLDMPVSLAQGHIRSPEFKINLDAGFWIFVEVETKVDDEGVSCLTGYRSDYCRTHGVRELRASWTLSDRGSVVARGSTDTDQGSRGGMLSKARVIGSFSVPAGSHLALDVDFPDDNSHFDGGHPRLVLEQSYPWRFEQKGIDLLLLAIFLAASGVALLLNGFVENRRRKRAAQRVSLTSPGPVPTGFHWETEPADRTLSPEPPRRRFTARTLFSFGLMIVGLAGFIIVERWIDTRIFVPLDIPVSLEAGHIRTGQFRINVEQWYSIWIDFDQSTYSNPACSSYNVLKSTWTLYRDGRVHTQWDTPILQDAYLQDFDATRGFYELDVHVLADASCLNANRPRLRVVTSREDASFYAAVMLWLTAASVVLGISLVILGRPRGVVSQLELSAIVLDRPTTGQNIQWAQKLPLRRRFVGLPTFGFVGGTVFAILAILMMLLTGAFRYIPQGLRIHLLKPGMAPVQPDAWTEPLIVAVHDVGQFQDGALSINSKVIARDDFARALKQELSTRRDWTVYVEGDDCIAWDNVVRVIDIARGYGAKVFLVPKPDKRPCQTYVRTNARNR